jgi:ubiquinone/menaquinone biosynthesis C-methylase UbiE
MDNSPWSRVKSEVYALIGRNPKSNRVIASVADLDPDHVVLDIGCGPGAAVRAVAGTVERVVGVDRSGPMIEIARRRSREVPNVEFAVGAAEALPFPDASFDRVWTIHSFHHWEDPARGIDEVLRVLRPGGRFLIVESESRGSHGLDRRRAEELAERLRGAGFGDPAVSKPGRQLVVTGSAPVR